MTDVIDSSSDGNGVSVQISGKSSVFAVIGDPIEHTLSPLMHNRAIKAMGLDAVYVSLHVRPDDLERAIKGMKALGIGGMNVTVPHKTAVMALMDDLSDEARAVGAVNTIIPKDGGLYGDNTDGYGFLKCLAEGGLPVLPERVCIIGAGGAARGVAFACAGREEVKELAIINRTVGKAEALADEIACFSGKVVEPAPADKQSFKRHAGGAGLVVNTTSVGMFPNEGVSPLPDPSIFHEGQYTADIVYVPLRTKFLDDAEANGAKSIEGLAMLAWQGARSLSLWTGMEAPGEVMMAALLEHFGRGM